MKGRVLEAPSGCCSQFPANDSGHPLFMESTEHHWNSRSRDRRTVHNDLNDNSGSIAARDLSEFSEVNLSHQKEIAGHSFPVGVPGSSQAFPIFQ
jgi:hypothetical protein